MSELPKTLDRIYIVNDDLKINYEQVESTAINVDKAKDIFAQKKYYDRSFKYLLNIDFLNVENFNKIDKVLKEELKRNFSDPVPVKKINKEQLTTIFKILGFNIIYCSQISECIIQDLISLLNIKYEKIKIDCVKSSMVIRQKCFYDIAKNAVIKTTGFKSHIKKYFHLAYLLVNKAIPVIVLLGGTSGTGKSTLASLLASRLGISTVLSTDSIRHIMRNFLDKSSHGVLFASTYEAHRELRSEECESLSDNKKIIKGYLKQSNLVNSELENVIDKLIKRRESVVVEGVHLTKEFIKKITMRHKYTLPFIVYISKAEKHKERFAVRSKLMTLDAKYNKYVENFDNIRSIQNYIVKKADESFIPKIDNNNIDKSLGIIQDTILRAILEIYKTQTLDESLINNLLTVYNKVSKNIMTSKEAKKLISNKINKTFLFEKYFKNDGDTTNDRENQVIKEQSSIHVDINSLDNLDVINNLNNINNLTKQSSKKECLSEPEGRINSELKVDTNKIEDSSSSRQNYQRTSKRNRSKRLFKFKSQSKIVSNKLYDNEKDKGTDDGGTDSVVSDSNYNKASVESDQDRIKVINETDDEIDSASEVNSKGESCGSISEGEQNKVTSNTNINVERIK